MIKVGRHVRSFCFITLSLIAAAGAAGQDTRPSTEAAGPLARALQPLVDKQLIAGAVVLVADRDKVLDREAIGYGSLRTHAPMLVDNLFWIASMSKSITATAFMMLVDEGKVSIEDRVEKYLPEFKGQVVVTDGDNEHGHLPGHPITVREVLSHTSGLIPASDPKATRAYSLKENVAGYAAAPLIREPGTKYEYNNCGISTAGRIIEVLSGMSYADFVQQRLFDPLEMKDTTFWPTVEQAKRLAHSARFTADKTALEEVQLDKNLTRQVIDRLSRGMTVPPEMIGEMGVSVISDYTHHFAEPAGGLYSTAGDLGNFCQMLLDGGVYHGKRLLSENAVRQMRSVQTGNIPVSPVEAYGLGWWVKIRPDQGLSTGSFGHRGARRPAMWVDPSSQLAMVLLVERFDMSGDAQNELYSTFLKAAVENYGAGRQGRTGMSMEAGKQY